MSVKEILEDFTKQDLMTTAGGWLAQAAGTLTAIPYFMHHLNPMLFTLVFFIGSGVTGLVTTHLTNKIVGTKTKALTSMKEDAVRGALYIGIQLGVATAVLVVGAIAASLWGIL